MNIINLRLNTKTVQGQLSLMILPPPKKKSIASTFLQEVLLAIFCVYQQTSHATQLFINRSNTDLFMLSRMGR